MTTWVPLLIAAVVLVVLFHARRWLALLVVIATVGGLLQNHVVVLPQAVAAPLAQWNRELHGWQTRQSAALACAVAQQSSVSTGTTAAYAQAASLCPSSPR